MQMPMSMPMQMQILPQVSFSQAIKLAFKNYANCSGRSRRSEFWFFYLFIYGSTMVFVFALSFIISIIAPFSSSDGNNSEFPVIIFIVFGCILFAYIIAISIPLISVTVRRLHDTGKSGFYYFVTFIPMVGGWLLLYFCIIDSDPNTNEYGPSPKYILPQNAPLNPNNSGYAIPVNPYPQPMPPQVYPYPQPIPPQVNPYPQPMPPQVNPYPQVDPNPQNPPQQGFAPS